MKLGKREFFLIFWGVLWVIFLWGVWVFWSDLLAGFLGQNWSWGVNLLWFSLFWSGSAVCLSWLTVAGFEKKIFMSLWGVLGGLSYLFWFWKQSDFWIWSVLSAVIFIFFTWARSVHLKMEIENHLKLRVGHLFSPFIRKWNLAVVLSCCLISFFLAQRVVLIERVSIPNEVWDQVSSSLFSSFSDSLGEVFDQFDLSQNLLSEEMTQYLEMLLQNEEVPDEAWEAFASFGLSKETIEAIVSREESLGEGLGLSEDMISLLFKAILEEQLTLFLVQARPFIPWMGLVLTYFFLNYWSGLVSLLSVVLFQVSLWLMKQMKLIRVETEMKEAERWVV